MNRFLIVTAASLAIAGCDSAADTPADDAAATATPDATAATQDDTGDTAGVAAADAGAVACDAGESKVWACSAPGKSAAICAASGTLALRYREAGKDDVVITSNGNDGNALRGGERGAVYQESLRFVKDGTDYVAYSAAAGEKTDVAGKSWSGVTVIRGEDYLSELKCSETGAAQEIASEPGGISVQADSKELGFLF